MKSQVCIYCEQLSLAYKCNMVKYRPIQSSSVQRSRYSSKSSIFRLSLMARSRFTTFKYPGLRPKVAPVTLHSSLSLRAANSQSEVCQWPSYASSRQPSRSPSWDVVSTCCFATVCTSLRASWRPTASPRSSAVSSSIDRRRPPTPRWTNSCVYFVSGRSFATTAVWRRSQPRPSSASWSMLVRGATKSDRSSRSRWNVSDTGDVCT